MRSRYPNFFSWRLSCPASPSSRRPRAPPAAGALVYCTCSFARAQNEDVVSAFLGDEPAARLVEVECLADAPATPGSLPLTLRFDPRRSRTSALFVAKLERVS